MIQSIPTVHAPPPGRRSNLAARVGNGMTNIETDIMWLKEVLRRLGRHNHVGEPHPYIDARLVEAIGGYQRDRGLKRDGLLNPGGETECTLCVELGRLMGRM